ncbi:hypothetical protein G5V59_07360 [Nocardioides sp. W3-2-3]|uniref:hypothetical protein n=1 Tax=Nocardioides convexus TaxID=2712224 RepID=UPI0024185FB5|nr:hypothetical protein [Nocardioides convexus]NHA00062.1 hypothetical protein [Nocardioides convexus]
MKVTLRKTAGLLGGTALALAAVATSTPAAHANPNWTLYNEGTGAPLTSTDVLSATGTAVFGATIAGSPHNITCTFNASNPLTVTTTGPFSGAPGTTLTVNATPPASTVCKNQAGVNVPVALTGTWGVSFVVPAAGTTPGQALQRRAHRHAQRPGQRRHREPVQHRRRVLGDRPDRRQELRRRLQREQRCHHRQRQPGLRRDGCRRLRRHQHAPDQREPDREPDHRPPVVIEALRLRSPSTGDQPRGGSSGCSGHPR